METAEIICTGVVTNLAELIKAYDFPKDAFFLAEQFPSHIIKQEQRQDLLLFARLRELEDIEKAQNYTSGRIFSQAFELRWEKESDGNYRVVYFGFVREISGLVRRYELHTKNESEEKYQVVYFGLDSKVPELGRDEPGQKNIEVYKADTKRYYLFGEHLEASQLQNMKIEPASKGNSYYAAVRIPRLLLYPRQSGARRLRLLVREYLDEATSRVQLFRFQDLVDGESRE